MTVYGFLGIFLLITKSEKAGGGGGGGGWGGGGGRTSLLHPSLVIPMRLYIIIPNLIIKQGLGNLSKIFQDACLVSIIFANDLLLEYFISKLSHLHQSHHLHIAAFSSKSSTCSAAYPQPSDVRLDTVV